MGIVASLLYIRHDEDPPVESTKSKKLKLQTTGEDSSLIMYVLTDDLLLEILFRLPHARSILRCAAVCRRWRDLLSSDGFDQRFERHHCDEDHSMRYTIVLLYSFRPCQLLFSEQSKALHSKSSLNPSSYLDFIPPEHVVLASSGELLLLRPGQLYPGARYVLCNPLTRQSVSLPPSPAGFRYGMCHGLVFGKDTSFFKVLRFDCHMCRGPNSVFPIEVFSSETGKWVQESVVSPPDMPPGDLQLVESALTAENGVMYAPFISTSASTGAFLALDPFSADEPKQGYFVNSPPGYDASSWRRSNEATFCCGLHRGHLRVAQCFGKRRKFTLKVWELGNDGSWVLLYGGALKRLPNVEMVFVKGFHPNKGCVVFVMDNLNAIYEYDFELEKYEKVGQIQSQVYSGCKRKYYGCSIACHALLHPTTPTPIPKIGA